MKKREVVFEASACRDLKGMTAKIGRQIVRDALQYLEFNPFPIGKPRIKKLEGYDPPLYRLRSGDYRVYYRTTDDAIRVLAVLAKKDSGKFLRRIEEPRRAYRRKSAKA